MSLNKTFPYVTPVINGNTWRSGDFSVSDRTVYNGAANFTRSVRNNAEWDLYFDYLDGEWFYSIFPSRTAAARAVRTTLEAVGFRPHPSWRE